MADSPPRVNPFTILANTAVLLGVAAAMLFVFPAAGYADDVRDGQWHLDYLNATGAHEISRGNGVTVAVVDAGVDHTHPDLKDAVLEGQSFAGGRRDGRQDATGHGTAMASLIAGRGHGPSHRNGVLGIAPAAEILPVRVKSGSSERNDARTLERGIDWAVEHDADIISIALTDIDDPYTEEAINNALDNNVVVVAGVGNTANGDTDVRWPARYPGVIAVSGVNRSGEFTDASTSGRQVVISAPATNIPAATTRGSQRYAAWTGTSAATALVAGTAALVKAEHPDLDAANIINRLIATADDQGPDGRDPKYGYGIVDPVAALTRDV
ncbi:MAG: S8 family serine peptidase, partial [Stackebrandtia sp.]